MGPWSGFTNQSRMSVSLSAAAAGDAWSKTTRNADSKLIFIVLCPRLSRRGEPGAGARLRVGIEGDVGHDGEDVGAGGQHAGRALDRQPADGDQRHGADSPLPFANFFKALRVPLHLLQDGRINRPTDRKSTRLNSS